MVRHDPFMPDHLGRQSLHHLNGGGAHASTMVEGRGHTEDNYIILFLRPMPVGALVSSYPGDGLHLLGTPEVDLNLSALRIQHRIIAEKLLSSGMKRSIIPGWTYTGSLM